jgi:hypothetical protein
VWWTEIYMYASETNKPRKIQYLEKPKYTVISRNTLVKAKIHLENAEIHLKIVQMNLQWIENDEINLKKLNNS